MARDRRVLFIVLASVVTLTGAFALKVPCVTHSWDDGYQLKHYCYSDVQYLYSTRHLDTGRLPYLQEFNEYPVITGFFSYHIAQLTDSTATYVYLTFVVLLAAAALTTLALWKLRLPWDRTLAWAAAPTLVIHGTTNWDLLAVAFTMWGWVKWREGNAFESATLFGLGGATKLYPVFFLPFLLVSTLSARDWKRSKRIAWGAVFGFVVPNFLVWRRNGDLWLETWRFQARREPDFETPWQAVGRHYGERWFPDHDWGQAWNDQVTLAVLVLLVVTFAFLAWRQRSVGLDPLAAGGAFTVAFLLINRVYSPQYTLWVVPILLAMEVRWGPFWAFVVADVAVFLVRWPLFTTPAGQDVGWDMAWDPYSRFWIIARWLLLTWCLVDVLGRQGFVGRRIMPLPGTATDEGHAALRKRAV